MREHASDQSRNPRRSRRQIVVRALSARSTQGHIVLGSLRFACALGRTGRKAIKREGDGATPMGRWRISHGFFRKCRGLRPRTGLAIRPIRENDGWCDQAGDRNYNRQVRLPYPASAERLMRADHLYDVVLVTSHNQCPRVRGAGSAIFLHVARAGFLPTEGCVALRARDLAHVLRRLGRDSWLVVPH
ncbi:MAG: L,D-transpeptidase family protein [Pseudomonadota bacterium]